MPGKLIGIIALLIFTSVDSVYSQTYGCKDPLANNYNPAATVNNGSCTYNVTNYTPPIKVKQLSTVLAETSGLQWAANSLWSFNDGGNSAVLYRIDTASNAILQTVTLAGATNIDWEDIAFDGTNFYIGDFGNNANGARTNLKIYKFPLSAIPDYTKYPQATIPSTSISIISFTYSDQIQPPTPVAANTTKYDCEAMIIDNAKIHLFTKNWADLKTTHYVINSLVAGTYVATPVETLATGYLVTGVDKAVNKNIVVLLGYQVTGFGNHYMHLLTDYSQGKYFNGNKRQINLPSAAVMGQGEGITFRNSTYGYISNEKVSTPLGTLNPMLRSFKIDNFIPANILSTSITGFKAQQNETVVHLTWSMENQEEIKGLELQRSLNGKSFTTIANINVALNDRISSEYNATNLKGGEFYRLKVVSKSGLVNFSEVAQVGLPTNDDLRVFPNPLSRGSLKVSLNNLSKGQYLVEVLKADGQKAFSRWIHFDGVTPFLPIELPVFYPSGLYTITICNSQRIYQKKGAFIKL